MKTNKPNIHEGHRHRLRERYAEHGIDVFRDHELLELLLSFCIPRKDTNPLGHALIERFGDLRGVLNADREELLEVPGIGENAAALIKLLPGLTRRYYEQLSDSLDRLDEPKKQMEFFIPRFIGRKRECLYAAFLDKNCRLIKCELQYEGSIDAVEIHQTRITNNALTSGAKKVLIAHNHFTECAPSGADTEATAQLCESLYIHGIILMDHIIVCGTNAVSLKENGQYNPPIQPNEKER